MSNFDFLKRPDGYYELFADACIEAERVFPTAPAMCAVGCRKALELAVKWVYAADATIKAPYKDNLSALLHEDSFRDAVDPRVWRCLVGVNKVGNLAVHTERKVTPADAMVSLRGLFLFVDWIDYCYGPAYVERSFDEGKIPPAGVPLTREQMRAIKARAALLEQTEDRVKALEAELAAMRAELAADKADNTRERSFNPEEISEFATRKRYIDVDLRLAGWDLDHDVVQERKVYGMPAEPGVADGVGYVDYLLLGKDGRPLAVLEAKRTAYSPEKGLEQARRYALCLEKEFGYRPPIFLSNGFTTFFCDDMDAPMREVSGVFSRADLQTIVNRRGHVAPLSGVRVNEDVAGRYYQIEAIRAVCANIEAGRRKSLLVMATGTGKTRVAAGLADVLMRAGRVKNVLFLADRVALVAQAKHAFQEHLPQATLCNLCKNKEDRNARIVFSTYPTILNAIDAERDDQDNRLYTPAHFDLVIVDEAHRSIFKKYRAIFQYFDALVVGLTATPCQEVDRNTYDFFEAEQGVPTYVYDYKTAVERDHVLVPYLGISTHTTFLDEGITYSDLSADDKERIEEDFEGVGQDVPDYIAPSQVDSWVFNAQTVDTVLEALMEKGIRINGGEELGKTIIFAQSQKHASFIVERFGKLYPKKIDGYIKRVVHADDYAHAIVDDFKLKERPVIAVSVDMMDTGIDVPEVVNLVFFKKVRSKIKFWQMIGRGTRLCPGLGLLDPLDGPHEDKRRFFIFDWCRNFEFFQEGGNEVEGKIGTSTSELIFGRRAQLVKAFQDAAFAGDAWQAWRDELVETIHYQVVSLDDAKYELVSVRLHRAAVEKFKREEAFECLGEDDLGTLKSELAPLVSAEEDNADPDALRFDALMYGFMCALCDGVRVGAYRKKLVNIAVALQQMITVPQVKEKLPVLQRVCNEHFFDEVSALELEQVRRDLRGLVRFLTHGAGRAAVYTDLADPVGAPVYGVTVDADEDYADYRLKVSRYLQDFAGNVVVEKLHRNEPLTQADCRELERIFTEELGSGADYARSFGDTPFGLLVRQVVKLDRAAAMAAFAEFVNGEQLTPSQIDFVHKIVDYVVENGSMEPAALARPPFDRPQSFVRLFSATQQARLVAIINGIRDNAVKPAA